MRSHPAVLVTRIVIAMFAAAALPVLAGELRLEWNPSATADGYNVYQGPASGSYGAPLDVGDSTTAIVGDLADCTTHYFVVTAYNVAGESTHSNEVASWPRPRTDSIVPSSAEQGRSLDLVFSGMNFQDGAVVSFSDPAVIVHSVAIQGCSEMTVSVTVGGNAGPGPVDVSVDLPSGPKGVATGRFEIEPATAPDVTATEPANGADGVSVAVRPEVTFSEPVDTSTVNSGTVRLLDPNDDPLPQAPGSPILDGDGVRATITPLNELVEGTTYRVQVIGGDSGVHDLAGHPMATTFVQPQGFGTVQDTNAPSISDVGAGSVAATSATIVWTTDEPADGLVLYRKSGTSDYLPSDLAPELTVEHAITLEGLTPDTTYEYHVVSADAAGNETESSPDETFRTASSTYGYLRFEAESGSRDGSMTVVTRAAAFQGEALRATADGSSSNPSGTALFGVEIPRSGTWFLWVRMYGDVAGSSAMFESVDGGSRNSIAPDGVGSWIWVAARQYDLAAGLHDVELAGRDAGALADRILLTDDPSFVPTEAPVGDNVAPGAVTGFEAVAAVESVELSWTQSDDPDATRVVIRYRTDGRYPVSPQDGLAVVDTTAAPGQNGSHVHDRLQAGTTYHYSAFSVDEAGNVGSADRSNATPEGRIDPPLPPEGLRVD